MALAVRLKSRKNSTTMVTKGKSANTDNTKNFKRKESFKSDSKEKDQTENVQFQGVKRNNDVKEGYELRKMRQRMDIHRKTLRERNVRRNENSDVRERGDFDKKTFSERNFRINENSEVRERGASHKKTFSEGNFRRNQNSEVREGGASDNKTFSERNYRRNENSEVRERVGSDKKTFNERNLRRNENSEVRERGFSDKKTFSERNFRRNENSEVRERGFSDKKTFSERNFRRNENSEVRERGFSDKKTFSERNFRRNENNEMRERGFSDKKTFSERNFRRKPSSSNNSGFDEFELQTAKKFHNRIYDRKDRNSKGEFEFKIENPKRRVDPRKENLNLNENSEENDGKKESENQNLKPKVRRLPSRVLDKTGKKIRVSRIKLQKKGSDGKNAQKKKKRVIKLDRCDVSNKRLDDIIPPPKEEDLEDQEKKAEMSKNAQFRAIIPSDSILSFVEENFLGRRRLNELTNGGYNVKLSAPLDSIPFTYSKERDRIEEPVFRNKMEFFAAAKVSSSFPPSEIPEIAFAGRSNVGKSSLLNSLTRQWGVARTSDKPGLTQSINFFRLASKLCLVDLPGYGFAYAKEEVKDAWEDLVKEYVSTRVGLQRVCLLVDTKWGMKPRDHELVDLMEKSQTPYQIVLTKTDVVFPIDVARRAMQIQEILKKNKAVVNPVMMVSSKSGGGIRNMRSVLAKLARFVKP